MKIMKQIIEFNKAAFEHSCAMTATLQEQMERMMSAYMDRASGFPEESRKALYEWMDILKMGCEDFKSSADDGFRKMEMLFSQKK